ncbi:MAG: hypothetical protein ABIP59_22985 [Roseateles sp.]
MRADADAVVCAWSSGMGGGQALSSCCGAVWAHVAVAAGVSVEAELALDPELMELIDAEG